MTETTHVQQLRKAISGEFYFGAMCHQTGRRIAISPDASRGKQRYSQSGETIVSCHHCQKEHRFDNREYSLFSKSDWNNLSQRDKFVGLLKTERQDERPTK